MSALLQLIPGIRVYTKQFPVRAMELVAGAAPDCTRKQHKANLQRLMDSVQEGLVCWLRWVTLSMLHVSLRTMLRLCCAGTWKLPIGGVWF